ncbi:ribonuclease H-like domain-containing protein [Colletotrichum godetiae]|uniref:Ribonuclease H-like domain-containing protein n=1 Tax=Colletotrichum godetiae TaxID=1209918 RepID=A0AAJ0AC62_9PEZI|nr:ribonuclease H-like domain-containing protein [Colletotrichum godetiae]KAK1659813.1 ribonuclease H-like domain-containing protein [Colletotrichum godetiae]
MSAGDICYSLVDSAESMSSLLTSIQNLPIGLPSLFLDLEGVSLSRNGSISLITIFFLFRSHVYLVDIHTMQSTAFSTAVGGTTFKQILESPDIIKVSFFDVRNDSDALFHHFQVNLSGIEDVQLMENAARPRGQRRYLNGLDKCIGLYAPLSSEEKARWKVGKEAGLKLFHPSRGGSYEVFNSRPMSAPIKIYCIDDVKYLPHLREALWRRLDGVWRQKVVEETKTRILESQSPSYELQSETKKFGPWGKG